MKTDIAGWTRLSLLLFLMATGCTHLDRPNSEIVGFYRNNRIEVDDSRLLYGRVVNLDPATLIYERGPGRLAKVFKTRFESKADSLKHLMHRQVAVSALFRDLIEPYYGLVERKKCVDLAQFNTDFIEPRPDEKYFAVKFPVDLYMNPLDCEREDPKMHAQYIFLSCEKRLEVYEIRLYQSIAIPFDDGIHFHCN